MKLSGVVLSVLILSGCASMPSGPRVMVLPGTGKSFGEFQESDARCRQYAARMIGQESNDPAVRDAVVSTAIGTVAGAAIGGRQGAGIGAGMGLIIGSVSGSEKTRLSGYEAQYRYDEAYIQCMYASGHRVPVPASIASSLRQHPGVATPAAEADKKAPAAGIPPPPPFAPPSSPPPDYVPSPKKSNSR